MFMHNSGIRKQKKKKQNYCQMVTEHFEYVPVPIPIRIYKTLTLDIQILDVYEICPIVN